MQILYFLALIQVFLIFFCLDLKKILVILICIFEYRSTFHHNTVWVLPVGAQILGTQSSRVPEGNTQKNPKF